MFMKRFLKRPQRSQLDQDDQIRFEKPELGCGELPGTHGRAELEAVSVDPSIPVEPPSAPPINPQEIVLLQAQITEWRSKYETEVGRHTQLREKSEAEASALRKEVETLKEQADESKAKFDAKADVLLAVEKKLDDLRSNHQTETKLHSQEQEEYKISLFDAEFERKRLELDMKDYKKHLGYSRKRLAELQFKHQVQTKLRLQEQEEHKTSLLNAQVERRLFVVEINDYKEHLEDCREELAECRSKYQAATKLRSQKKEESKKSLFDAKVERERLRARMTGCEEDFDHLRGEVLKWRTKYERETKLRSDQERDHEQSLSEIVVERNPLEVETKDCNEPIDLSGQGLARYIAQRSAENKARLSGLGGIQIGQVRIPQGGRDSERIYLTEKTKEQVILGLSMVAMGEAELQRQEERRPRNEDRSQLAPKRVVGEKYRP